MPFTGTKRDDNEINLDKDIKKGKTKSKSKKPPQRLNYSVKSQGLDDPVLQRDICILTKQYLKGDAILDIIANIPGLVYTIMLGQKVEGSDLSHLFDDKVYVTFMALKILRLAHVDEV